MKRAAIIGAAALCLMAASSREAYRAAYQAWRQADPNLERDAAAPDAKLADRINAVAAQAAKYGAERGAFLRESAAEQEQELALLQKPAELENPSRGVRENVAAETAVVKHNLDTFANDPDPGIQRLKSMLERENLALTSLANAVAERQSAADSAKSANDSAEQARTKALNSARDLAGALKLGADGADREVSAWAEYYRKLAQPAPAETVAAPATPAAPTATAPLRNSITPLPLARYVGAWTFPDGGLYHGPQPEFLDMVVHEENGHATGTLFARFKVAAGSKDDPVLRFDFSGDFKNARNQSFALETSDGAKGTIELIPGPAFNLLEVNFQTDPKPGKVRMGNMVLIKK